MFGFSATAHAQAGQLGAVHSCTTNGTQSDITYNGGEEWFDTAGPPAGHPTDQAGVVHSYTTGGNATVLSFNGGLTWYFFNGGQLPCSPP